MQKATLNIHFYVETFGGLCKNKYLCSRKSIKIQSNEEQE